MKVIKKIIKKLFYTKKGKPVFLAKYFLFSTFIGFVHKWISAHIEQDDKILDIGARSFPFTIYQEVKKIVGIDIYSKTTRHLGWTLEKVFLLRKKNPIVSPVFANCESLPFAQNYFDKIIMIEVIEHLENYEKAIAELAAVLKQNGKFLLTTPNGDEVPNTNPYHIKHFKLEELRILLSKYFNNVYIDLKFPDKNLYIKQYMQENKFILKRLFWRYIYDLWHLFFSDLKKNCYTIIAVCSNPIRNA